jgi:uncharacterized protein YbjT (DUF2867 family)
MATIAITGGTGFVGGHLAKALALDGHDVVVVARGVDERPLAREVRALPGVRFVRAGSGLPGAFDGCDAVAHCAGINREIGAQTYETVNVRGTADAVRAAEEAGVGRFALVSFLRARPGSGCGYFESKWAAEEIVRGFGGSWTVLKPGMIYGRGDQTLDHLSHALYTFPVFAGIGPRRIRPVAVADVVRVLAAALVGGRLAGKTVPLTGPTELTFDDAARMVARITGKSRLFVRAPIAFHYGLAYACERLMTVPLVSLAQVRILREEIIEAVNAPDRLPDDLLPATPFDEVSVRAGLPEPGRFGLSDLRCSQWFRGRLTQLRAEQRGGSALRGELTIVYDRQHSTKC